MGDGGAGRRAAEGAGRRAVVIGGGVAGLLAARVLAEHCGRVTIVERDRLPEAAEHRAGVPHGRHIHVLLEGGQLALEELLPGVVGELREAGAPRVGMPADMVQWQAGRWFRRTAASTHLSTGSRPLLEEVLRRRVRSDPRVEVVQGTEVTGLTGTAGRVTGVTVRARGEGGERGAGGERRKGAGRGETLPAELVVDASGRGSKAPEWLTALGAEPPAEEVIDTGLAYSSRLYAPTALGSPDCLGYYVVPGPEQVHGAVVLPLEDGRLLVTLSGVRGCEPPTDPEGFTAFAKRLPHPFVHEWLSAAEPVTAPFGFRNTANVRRRYDRPGRRPAGFLAIGDALCTFNPIYGQGMTVAAQNAVALRDALGDPERPPRTRQVQRALVRSARQAWDISAGADKAMPGATGNAAGVSAAERPAAWYLSRVQRRSSGDPLVGAAFRSVLSLREPLTALFAPRVLRAVLFGPEPTTPAGPPWRREPEPTQT